MKSKNEKKASPLLTDYYSTSFFLLVLLFLAASTIFLLPLMDGLKSKNTEMNASLKRLSGERAYLQSLEQSIVAADIIPATVLERADRALPRDSNLPELLALLGNVAETDGVKLNAVNFSEVKSAKSRGAASATSSIMQTQINLSVGAEDYPQIKRFLRHLESSLRILDIVGINVTLSGDRSVYAVQLNTYSYRPPAAPTGNAGKKL